MKSLYEEFLKKMKFMKNKFIQKFILEKHLKLYIEEIKEIISTFTTLDKDTLREKLVNLANQKQY